MTNWTLYALTAFGAVSAAALLRRTVSGGALRVLPAPAGYEELEYYAKKVDKYIPDFSLFARSAAYTESGGKSSAANRSPSEADAACRGYHNNATRFANNPHPAADWCWGSGGYFGFLPSTALSAQGFHNQDPYLVFDPAASVAMLADFVRRVYRGHFHKLPYDEQNWLAMRRFMASNRVGLDWQENLERSPKTRARFEKALQAVGIPTSFMRQHVTVNSNWPGAYALWQEIKS